MHFVNVILSTWDFIEARYDSFNVHKLNMRFAYVGFGFVDVRYCGGLFFVAAHKNSLPMMMTFFFETLHGSDPVYMRFHWGVPSYNHKAYIAYAFGYVRFCVGSCFFDVGAQKELADGDDVFYLH